MTDNETYQRAKARAEAKMGFYRHAAWAAGLTAILAVINLITFPGYLWFLWAALGMGISVAVRAFKIFGYSKADNTVTKEEISETVDERTMAKTIFYRYSARAAGLTAILMIINLITSPGYLWFLWAVLGMAISIAIRAFKTFGNPKLEQMEEEMIEKELEKEKT